MSNEPTSTAPSHQYDHAAAEAQLRSWLAGNPMHDHVNNQCCPDFSCCCPGTMADLPTREAFVRANSGERVAMCGMFLGAILEKSTPDVDVHIAGDAEVPHA